MIMQTPLPLEVTETLNLWSRIPPGGSLDWDCYEYACAVCGGRGSVRRPNAALYADEQDAEIPCPACFPLEIN